MAYKPDIYKDEEITPHSQNRNTAVRAPAVKSPGAAVPVKESLSETIRRIRTVNRRRIMMGYSPSAVFAEQARIGAGLMLKGECDTNYAHYYPSYDTMNDRELLSYFVWRTRLRHGEEVPRCDAFAYVYIYEIINLIGFKEPSAALTAFISFARSYKTANEYLIADIRDWIADFCVYYNIPPEEVKKLGLFNSDNDILGLINPEETGDDRLFELIKAYSSYNICNSLIYKKHPDTVKAIVTGVYRDLDKSEKESGGPGLFVRLFGEMKTEMHHMFSTALFFSSYNSPERYEISPVRIYTRKYAWYLTSYGKLSKKSMGALLKITDATVRDLTGFKSRLQYGDAPDRLISDVNSSVVRVLTAIKAGAKQSRLEEKKRRIENISIDASLLGEIRRASDETMMKLIVDEEELSELYSLSSSAAASEPPAAPPADENNETGGESDTSANKIPSLTDAEKAVLDALLGGASAKAAAKKHGKMPGAVTETLNEKFFDLFQDNIILFDSDEPELIPDYEEELKGLLTE